MDLNNAKRVDRAQRFEHFKPRCPNCIARRIRFLANIAPSLPSHVLDQVERPRFVVADTMDLWIETGARGPRCTADTHRSCHLECQRSARRYEETSSSKAGRRDSKDGAALVAIKKGEHGACSLARRIFQLGRPTTRRYSPTPTGQGNIRRRMAGYLAGTVKKVHFNHPAQSHDLRGVLASFCVEAFSSNACANCRGRHRPAL